MSLILRQSTSKAVSFGPFLDKTDGVTPETGLVSAIDHATTGILLSKNGGALTIRSQAVTASTYDAYGNYIVTLSTTDTNTVGTLRMQFIETATCLPVWQDFVVVEEATFDALFAASAPGYLQPTTAGRTLTIESDGMAHADVKEWLGTAPLALSSQQVQAVVPVTQKVDVETIKTNAVVNGGTITFPSNATLASTTNITGGTITTTTNLTNLPAITSNWLTAAGIAASALDGKGNWNIGKTGYSLTATTGLGNQTADITGNLSGSVGSISGVTFPTNFGATSITAGGIVKADLDTIKTDGTSASNLAKTTRAIGRGTVTTGATTTSIPTSAFTPNGAAADQFKGRIITFDADTTTTTLRGQSTDITASTNAAAPTFTVTALTHAPASGDTFSVT